MIPVAALLFDGRSTAGHAVKLTATATTLTIDRGGESTVTPLGDLRVTSRLAAIRRVIALPDGRQVHCDDNEFVDRLQPHSPLLRLIDRLERHPIAVATGLLIIVATGAVLFALGIPLAAERIARHIPPDVEVAFGDRVLARLDETLFEPSRIPEQVREQVAGEFRALTAVLPDAQRLSLHFREMPGLHANAFALPGGHIVVSDALIAILEIEEARMAVLAHEIGHNVERHLLRDVLQTSFSLLAIGLLIGDVSATQGILLAVPAFILRGHYSRDFERAADAYAHQALAELGVSPAWFAFSLAQLEAAAGRGNEAGRARGYLSSHPSDAERAAAAHAAAHGFAPVEVAYAERLAGPDAAHSTTSLAPLLVGCWAGSRTTSATTTSAWSVQFEADGRLRIRFDTLDADAGLQRSSFESGRWIVNGPIMVTRFDQSGPSYFRREPTEYLAGYRIDHLDASAMRYLRLPQGDEFLSLRVDCERVAWPE